MMNDKKYNEFFRNRLDDFSSEVPEHIWQNISIKKDQKQKAGIGLVKYIVASLFLMLTFHTTDVILTSGNKVSVYSSFTKTNTPEKEIHIDHQDTTFTQNQFNQPYSAIVNKDVKNRLSFANSSREKKNIKTSVLQVNSSYVTGKIAPGSASQQNSRTTDSDKKNGDSSLISVENKIYKTEKNSLQKHADSTADIIVNEHQNSDRLFLYLFASPDLSFAHVTSANNDYQQLRNKQASMRLSYSAGARFRVNITDRWSANAGVQYSLVSEKIKTQNGAFDNRYKSLDLPLTAGYRMYKNKLEIDVNAGIILNVSSSYSGYISALSGEAINIHKSHVYKSNTEVSYYGGLQFLLQPDNKISLFAEPYFKYQSGSIVSSFQPFKERVQKSGLLLGARYRFDK